MLLRNAFLLSFSTLSDAFLSGQREALSAGPATPGSGSTAQGPNPNTGELGAWHPAIPAYFILPSNLMNLSLNYPVQDIYHAKQICNDMQSCTGFVHRVQDLPGGDLQIGGLFVDFAFGCDLSNCSCDNRLWRSYLKSSHCTSVNVFGGNNDRYSWHPEGFLDVSSVAPLDTNDAYDTGEFYEVDEEERRKTRALSLEAVEGEEELNDTQQCKCWPDSQDKRTAKIRYCCTAFGSQSTDPICTREDKQCVLQEGEGVCYQKACAKPENAACARAHYAEEQRKAFNDFFITEEKGADVNILEYPSTSSGPNLAYAWTHDEGQRNEPWSAEILKSASRGEGVSLLGLEESDADEAEVRARQREQWFRFKNKHQLEYEEMRGKAKAYKKEQRRAERKRHMRNLPVVHHREPVCDQ